MNENITVCCGEILLVKNIWQLRFLCKFCGEQFEKLNGFLNHSSECHYVWSDGKVKSLLKNALTGDMNCEEAYDDAVFSDEYVNVNIKVEKFGKEEFQDKMNRETEFLEENNQYETLEDYANIDTSMTPKTESLADSSNNKLEGITEFFEKYTKAIQEDDSATTVGFEIELLAPQAQSSRRRQPAATLKVDEDTNSALSTEPWKCTACFKRYKSSTDLKQHLKEHKADKRFKCEYCNACFRDNSNLKVHRYRHLGIKPHACSLCEKAFTSSTELKLHMRTHTGERPYTCTECDRAFTNATHLSAHRRRHFNERPYVCPICGKGFYDNKMLREHKPVHSEERPFECVTCCTKFSRRKALIEHRKLHSDVKRYSCKICCTSYAQNSGLHSHIRTHHPKE